MLTCRAGRPPTPTSVNVMPPSITSSTVSGSPPAPGMCREVAAAAASSRQQQQQQQAATKNAARRTQQSRRTLTRCRYIAHSCSKRLVHHKA